METKFSFKTFNDYLTSIKSKEERIDNIYDSFEKEFNTNIINLTKNLINVHIIDKLERLIEQFSNNEIKELETNKTNQIDYCENQIQKLKNEKESILGIITANLKQKKKVYTIKLATSMEIDGLYLAYIGNIDNGNYTEILTNEDDINLAKRFLSIDSEIESYYNQIENIKNEFKENMKQFKNYMQNDFSQEFELLSRISDIDIINLNELTEKSYIYLYGNVEDYDQYQKSIKQIIEKYKQLNEILAK